MILFSRSARSDFPLYELLNMNAAFEKQIGYFKTRQKASKHFLSRFPHGIDFIGKRVLDFGCGHGAVSLMAAEQGAQEVVGVDLNDELIGFARHIQSERFAHTADTLRFANVNILDGDFSDFDIVLSEATFEHVDELDKSLDGIGKVLKVGGRLYTGYSPLYNAPWGDHGRLKAPLRKFFPWAHLFFPKRWLLKRIGRLESREITSLNDLGLNGFSFHEHKRLLHSTTSMKVVHFETNNRARPVLRLIEPLRRLPGIQELLTFGIVAILEKE